MTATSTPHRRGARLAAAASGVVLLASAAYMVLYIARWEWTRALISAAVLIAMLSVVSTAMVLTRLGRLEEVVRRAIVTGERAEPDSEHRPPSTTSTTSTTAGDRRDESPDPASRTVAATIGAAGAHHARRHFAWLQRHDGTAVFIPVLLGAGMVLSACAWLVERLSGAVAGATLDRRIAAETPLDLPLGPHVVEPDVSNHATSARRSRRAVAAFAVGVVVVFGLGIEATRRITQSNEAENTLPGTTTVVVDIHTKTASSAATMATTLWSVCAQQLAEAPDITGLAAAGDIVAFQVDRALGATARRRVMGCLEDFTLDRTVAAVLELSTYRLVDDDAPADHSARSNLLQRWMPKAVSS